LIKAVLQYRTYSNNINRPTIWPDTLSNTYKSWARIYFFSA
jgi:hypothetical protein